jgi:Xaa-Pro aminopeptidase
MATLLLYGDTVRSPALRHEVPLEIVDPFLYVARGDDAFVLTNALELARIQAALPRALVQLRDAFGWFELIEEGMPRDEADLEVSVRALREWGIDAAVVPGELPVGVADRLRAEGLRLEVDSRAVQARRRVKSPAELDGIRRAQRAAEAGMAAAEELIRSASHAGADLEHAGEPLTAETVRAAVRAACADAGAPAPPDIMVVSLRSGGGHDPGSGPLPAGLPITIDLWPRDDASGCWADMTRTFVAGPPPADVVRWHALCLEAHERVLEALAPGVTGQRLWEIACDVVEAAGEPTQRAPGGRSPLHDGFFHSLGHGVGLDVHEAPLLGRGGEPLVAGDVVTVEPGVYREGYGGVRLEDLFLVTDDGWERLTHHPMDLSPR